MIKCKLETIYQNENRKENLMNQDKYIETIITRLKKLIIRDLESKDMDGALRDSLNLCEVYDDFYRRTKERDKKLIEVLSELSSDVGDEDNANPLHYDFMEKSSWLYNDSLDKTFSERLKEVAADKVQAQDKQEPEESASQPVEEDDEDEAIVNPIKPENYEFDPEEALDYEIPENDQVFEMPSGIFDKEEESSETEISEDEEVIPEEVAQMESEPSSLFAEKITVDEAPTKLNRRSLFRKGMSASDRIALYSGNGSIFEKEEPAPKFDDESDYDEDMKAFNDDMEELFLESDNTEDAYDEILPEAPIAKETSETLKEDDSLPSLDSFIEPVNIKTQEESEQSDSEFPFDDKELGNLSSVDIIDENMSDTYDDGNLDYFDNSDIDDFDFDDEDEDELESMSDKELEIIKSDNDSEDPEDF